MQRFKTFIAEGGNVKVGPKGSEVSAAPFSVTAHDRSQRRDDIHHALGSIHDAFHKEHGEHLFGHGQSHLHSGKVYSGSSEHLMGHHVSDEEFAKHKHTVGDVDVQVSHDHKNKLEHTLKPGRRFGKYTVAGTKKHGTEISAVMKHDNGEHHQFDFEGVHHPGSESEHFLHSSHWDDVKKGIKGVHHKMLINAAGGEKHKFSITHGVRSRTDDKDPGETHPTHVAHRLFGKDADHHDIHSFGGVTKLIKKHIPASEHQAIYDKFKSSVASKKDTDHTAALDHLKKHLGVKDEVKESILDELTKNKIKSYYNSNLDSQERIVNKASKQNRNLTSQELDTLGKRIRGGATASNKIYGGNAKVFATEETTEHVHVAFMGASPHTHMGHHMDVVSGMGHGKKFIGLSGKSDVFSDKEREDIANKQSAGHAEFKVEKSAGQTVGRAFHSMKGSGKKELHLHFGHDRKDMAERLKSSIEAGKIPELNGHKPDKVHIHYPKDENRSHGMSGTKMRTAAHEGDLETYKKHLGPNFSDKEAKKIMDRTRVGLLAGKIKVKR